MKRTVAENDWPNAIASNPSSILPHAEMLWLEDKLRPVERRVKRWPKKREVIALEQHNIELKYSQFINLHPQALNRISAALTPLLHRFIAANPQGNPQIFRAFSASFAHETVRSVFRSVCAAISQELAD